MKNRLSLAAIAVSSLFSILPSFGYTIEGESWTRNRTVLMHLSLPTDGGRGIAPSLAGFGIADPLSDPMLELHEGAGNLISSK